MSPDQSLIGETVVKLMDTLEADPPEAEEGRELEIVAVGIAVVVNTGSSTVVRIEASEDYYHQVVGLFMAAFDVAKGEMEAID